MGNKFLMIFIILIVKLGKIFILDQILKRMFLQFFELIAKLINNYSFSSFDTVPIHLGQSFFLNIYLLLDILTTVASSFQLIQLLQNLNLLIPFWVHYHSVCSIPT